MTAVDHSRRRLPAVAKQTLGKPLRGLGSFFAVSMDTLVAAVHPPFAWREFILQSWFVARVSLVPAIFLAVPFTVLVVFAFNILLIEIGAADFSGSGAALATISQIGPIVTVVVVAGTGATAMCADLGARTIREELDAMRVMGINPIAALVVPRVAALTLNSVLLYSIVSIVGLTGGYFFGVYFQHITPGSYVGSLQLIVGLREVIIAICKAVAFGLTAGLIACFKGVTVGGGPQGVGNAVNETVVYAFVALMILDVLGTAIGIEAMP